MSRPLRLCPCLWLCIFLTLTSLRAEDMITLENKCSFPVWPGIIALNQDVKDIPEGFRPLLNSGESYSVAFPEGWSGGIWGRFGCSFDESGRGSCPSGNCQGLLRCQDIKDMAYEKISAPFTEVKIVGGSNYVTLESGYNLPVSIKSCGYQECTAPVADVCPTQLQMKVKDEVVGCNGECDLNDRKCYPPEFGDAFEKTCPDVPPFRGQVHCTSTDFTITFCPPR